MTEYFYSAKENVFLPSVLKDMYVDNGSWPKDAKPIDQSYYQKFACDVAPEGKMRIAGNDGLPTWGDIPSPTKQERLTTLTNDKNLLIKSASDKISVLQDAVDLDMATDEEKEKLVDWKKYRVLLNRLDLNKDNVEFPKMPE